MQQRITWQDLPVEVRAAISARTGGVEQIQTVSEGMNSALAVILHTGIGRVFVKGVRTDHPGIISQQREALINPYVQPLAPAALWHLDDIAGWNVLAFEYIDGRHPNYAPSSADLPTVVEVMRLLGALRCPEVTLKDARQRWAVYFDRPDAADILAGDSQTSTCRSSG